MRVVRVGMRASDNDIHGVERAAALPEGGWPGRAPWTASAARAPHAPAWARHNAENLMVAICVLAALRR